MSGPAVEHSGSKAKRRWPGVLRALFAVALLAIVGWNLPWKDRAELCRDQETRKFPGELIGDWRSNALEFLPLPEQDAERLAWLEEQDRARFAAHEPLRLERAGKRADGQPADGWSWQPGMLRLLSELEPMGLVQGLSLFVAALLIGITRWWRLLAVAGCRTSWWNALRLSFIGLFFNLVVPGLTGGDLVKAVVVAREHPGRKLEAVFSIALDRILGLASLLALTSVVVLLAGETFAQLRLPIVLGLGLGLAGALAYAHRGLRSLLRIDTLLARLPLGDKLKALDDALLLFGRHPWELCLCALISLGCHACSILGVYVLGRSFGVGEDSVSLVSYFIIVPVANIASALPLAPAGWGLGEAVYGSLFELAGAGAAVGVAVSVCFRLAQMLLSLLGGLFLLLPSTRSEVEAARGEASR